MRFCHACTQFIDAETGTCEVCEKAICPACTPAHEASCGRIQANPFADLMEEMERRLIDYTELRRDNIYVSTVFLPFDYSFGIGPEPILFETMVFGGPLDGEWRRYATKGQALVGHLEMVEQVRQALDAELGGQS